MKRIVIINGPNLDRLGRREPEIYGTATLADLEKGLRGAFGDRAILEFFQSNHEGDLVDRIGRCADEPTDGLVINAAALTHTSIAIRDAVSGTGLPAIEVHLSNVYRREDFRHASLLAPVCVAVIAGLGFDGYHAAVGHLLARG